MLTDDKNLIEIYQDYIDDEGYVQRYNYDRGRYYNTGTSLKGPKGNPGNPGRPGKDGLTPRINQDNGHWMIGDVDTGVMAGGGQSDWNQNDSTKLDYIKNKPTISSGSVILNDSYGAFDLSVHNAVNGVPTTYADLSAALTALNALDSTYKKPGMSFRFVRTSDNKYVQYRYMGTAVTGNPNPFLDEANWQGVDDIPTASSNNLVKSDGIVSSLLDAGKPFAKNYTFASEERWTSIIKIKLEANVKYKIALSLASAVSSTITCSIRDIQFVNGSDSGNILGSFNVAAGSTSASTIFTNTQNRTVNLVLYYCSVAVTVSIKKIDYIESNDIKDNTIRLAKLNNTDIDETPTKDSTKIVRSGGVFNAINELEKSINGTNKIVSCTAGSSVQFSLPVNIAEGQKVKISLIEPSNNVYGLDVTYKGSNVGRVLKNNTFEFTASSAGTSISFYATGTWVNANGDISVVVETDDVVTYRLGKLENNVSQNNTDIDELYSKIGRSKTIACTADYPVQSSIKVTLKQGQKFKVSLSSENIIDGLYISTGGTNIGRVLNNNSTVVTASADVTVVTFYAESSWVHANGNITISVSIFDYIVDKVEDEQAQINNINTSLRTLDKLATENKDKINYITTDAFLIDIFDRTKHTVGYCKISEKLCKDGDYKLRLILENCSGKTITDIGLFAAADSAARTKTLFSGTMSVANNFIVLDYVFTCNHETNYIKITFSDGSYFFDWKLTLMLIYGNKSAMEFFSDYNYAAKLKNIEVKDMKEWLKLNAGLFIHWGVYSTTGGNYTGLNVYGENVDVHNVDSVAIFSFCKIPKETYKAYQSQFTAEHWDGDAIAKMAYDAGLSYICITAKHAEGFFLFDDENADWNVSDSAARVTILDELKKACDKYGLKFCLYFNQSLDWMNEGGYGQAGWNNGVDPYTDEQHSEYMEKQKLILENMYARFNPYMVWFDSGYADIAYNILADWREKYHNIIINDRLGGSHGTFEYDFVTGEGSLSESDYDYIENCAKSSSLGWGYGYPNDDTNDNSQNAKCLCFYILNSIAMGCNALINVAPKGDGSICTAGLGFLSYMADFVASNGTYNGQSIIKNRYEQPDWGRVILDGTDLKCYVMTREDTVRLSGVYNKFIKGATLNIDGSDLTIEKIGETDVVISGLPVNNDVCVFTIHCLRKPIYIATPKLVDDVISLMGFFPRTVTYTGFGDRIPYVTLDSSSQRLISIREFAKESGTYNVGLSIITGHSETYEAQVLVKNVNTGVTTTLNVSNSTTDSISLENGVKYEFIIKYVSGTIVMDGLSIY